MLDLGRCRIALVAGILLILGSAVRGEAAPVLERGAHVRVFVTPADPLVPHVETLTGTLLGLSDSVLTLEERSDAPVVVPRQNITGLDLRVRESQRGKGAMIGLGVGIGLGIVLGMADGDDKPGLISLSAGEKAAIGAAVLGPLGLLIGLVAAPGEQWQAVPPDRMLLSSSATGGREFRLSVATRF